MLLRDLTIKKHRGLDNICLSDLPSVSLIIGQNNTGKSSILEAASLLMRPHDPSTWVHAARQRDSDADLADTLWAMFRSRGMLNLEDGPQQSEFSELLGTLNNQKREFKVRAVATEDSWFVTDELSCRACSRDQSARVMTVYRRGRPKGGKPCLNH